MTTKKIMLAVDDSQHTKYSVNYAAHMSSTIKNLHYVLYHTQPMISIYLQDEAAKSASARGELNRLVKRNEEKAQKLLDDIRDQMVKMGIEQDRIETRTEPKKLGIAKDILGFSREKRYDAVALGRRGVSGIQKQLMGSVTADLVEHARDVPIWIIDGKVDTRKILVAVDGSDASLRALDHVSFMVGNNPSLYLTLMHIKVKGGEYSQLELDEHRSDELEKIIARGNEKFVDDFHSRGVQMLKDSGISEDRYEIRLIEKVRNVGKAILEKAEQENFGTIVMGRRGINKSFFLGSVSRYVLNNAENRALWIVS